MLLEHLTWHLGPGDRVSVAGVNGSGKTSLLRTLTGDLRPTSYQAQGYDRDLSFMLVEIAGDAMYFRAVNRLGETVDRGKIVRRKSSS